MKRKSKRAQLAPIISNFLFHSNEDPKDEQKEYIELKITIREYLTDKYFRRILAEILFDLQKDVAGGTRQRLFHLFVGLGLHHDSYKKLGSWRWNKVSQGILELAQMEVPDAFQFISKYINDRRGVVRKQAEIAIVSLQKDGLTYLLDNTKYAISEWQQIKLIEALGNIKDYVPPKFKSWLLSNNNDVVLFALRLIKHFNQNEASPSIAELVKHKDDTIKIAAISCIQDFNFIEALTLLKNVFWKCNAEVKIQILETVGQLGQEPELLFLREVAKTESNFSVVSKALTAINTIAPDSVLPTKDIVEDLDTPIVRSKAGLEDSAFLDMEVSFEELIPENKETKEFIEVEEVEVYEFLESTSNDVLEHHSNSSDEIAPEIESKIQKEEVITNEEVQELVFDFELLDAKDDDSLNFSLGLLNSTVLGTDSSNTTEMKHAYAVMGVQERRKFLDTLEVGSDKRETDLLEFIMEHEEDSELRFRAFNILKKLKNVEYAQLVAVEKEESEKELIDFDFLEKNGLDGSDIANQNYRPEDSIFYSLYQHASDFDSKIILVKQAIEVSDEKDIPFFRYLIENAEDSVSKLAQNAIDQLVASNVVSDEGKTDLKELETVIVTTKEKSNVETAPEAFAVDSENENKIPLELCFLYDELGILYSNNDNKEDLGLNFDLSDEFFRDVITETLNQES